MGRYLYYVTLLVTLFSCESDNIQDKYLSNRDELHPTIYNGLLAWLPLNGNIQDSTGTYSNQSITGIEQYGAGRNEASGQGLYLDGSSFLSIDIEASDSIAVVMWINSDAPLPDNHQPVLLDYGDEALSVAMDATTGATQVNLINNGNRASSADAGVAFLNSFNRYCMLYIEVTPGKTFILFKGFDSNDIPVFFEMDYNFVGIHPESGKLLIGKSSKGTDYNTFFKGHIDEVLLFDRPLTQDEINAFYLIPVN